MFNLRAKQKSMQKELCFLTPPPPIFVGVATTGGATANVVVLLTVVGTLSGVPRSSILWGQQLF